ncbi:MAG: SCO family protein [Azospirillaceae bacterium]|nr:SCO family protein [Azospirillaceae bacterium]
MTGFRLPRRLSPGPGRRHRVAIIALIILAATAIGGYLGLAGPGAGLPGTVPVVGSAIGGPFTLVDDHGRTVHDTDYRGKILLLYFGYSFCPDLCPTALQTMAQTLSLLADDAATVQALFITVDPGRDTPEKLSDYVHQFDPRLIGLTGDSRQIAAVTAAYHVQFTKVDGNDPATYLVDHSSFFYVTDADGKFAAMLESQATPDQIAAVIRAQRRNPVHRASGDP